MKCSKCGKEISNDSNFCEYCGSKVKSSKRKKAIWIVLAILLASCIYGGIYITDYYQQHPEPYSIEMIDSISSESNSICKNSSLSQTEIDSLLAHGYVDLELPSGTLWKEKSERGFFDYHNSVQEFGNMLPTKTQFQELIDFCKWSWSGWNEDPTYYKVTGKNGKSIVFVNNGYIASDGKVYGHNQTGLYWTSTKNGDAENSYVLCTYRENVDDDTPFEGNRIEVTDKVYQCILKSVHLAR